MIYSSSIPPVPTYTRSIFTHLFSSSEPGAIGNYPASHPAFIDSASGATITRQQLKQFALAFGYGLIHHPKLTPQKRGDTLLIYSPNSLAFPVVLFGGVAAGLRCTPANSAYTSRELGHQYVDSHAKVIATSEDGLPVVLEMFRELGVSREEAVKRVVVIETEVGWVDRPEAAVRPSIEGILKMAELLAMGSLKEEEKFEGPYAHETCYICYSSGTTGKPKGVETTHANLTTVVDMGQTLFPAKHGDRLLGVLPFFHIYGAAALIQNPFLCGATVIIQNRFDPDKFCENIERYKITTAIVVPPILVVLTRHPAVDKYDLSSLKVAFSAAAPLGTALIHQVTERLRSKGSQLVVMQGYGLTETSPITHILPPTSALKKAGSIGVLMPNLEARIVADSNGDTPIDSADGARGELWLRGPTIMKGYLNNQKATAESITTDGWFKSGDVCVRDRDGFYWIVDRGKELIKYKGFQVPPSELESVLLTHPDIADCAVIGVEDIAEATELPRAYIVHADPERMKASHSREAFAISVRMWMESKVANHKFLRGGVSVIEQIPKSAAGKILRRELRERAKQEAQTQMVATKL